MAYTSGTAANPAALCTAIESFCTTNGFTLNSGTGSWLTKGNIHVRLVPNVQVQVSTITRSGTTVTVTTSGNHGFSAGQTVYLLGADQDDYRGQQTIVATPTTTTFTYTTAGTPVTPATFAGLKYVINLTQTSSTCVCILAGNDSTGTVTNVAQYAQGIYVRSAYWPISYELFYSGSPDVVCCVIKYDTDKYQHIQFGDSVKIHSSAFTGGWWFSASKTSQALEAALGDTRYITLNNFAVTSLTNSSGINFAANNQSETGSCCIGADTFSSASYAFCNKYYCSTDSVGWGALKLNHTNKIMLAIPSILNLFYSPNTWNSQSHLVPIQLDYTADTYRMRLGYLEHIRLVRLDNYNPGDTIQLGSDYWKVYPLWYKNIAQRNGGNWQAAESSLSTGTVGYAIRYVA